MNNKRTSQVGREPVTDTPNATQKITVIKMALDVHAAKLKVCRQLGDLPQQPVQTLTPKAFLSFAQGQLKLAKKVICCYEAGPTGFWLHRSLTARGLENYGVVP